MTNDYYGLYTCEWYKRLNPDVERLVCGMEEDKKRKVYKGLVLAAQSIHKSKDREIVLKMLEEVKQAAELFIVLTTSYHDSFTDYLFCNKSEGVKKAIHEDLILIAQKIVPVVNKLNDVFGHYKALLKDADVEEEELG